MAAFQRVTLPAGAIVFMVLASSPASAHAFGTRYDLPIPLGIFIWSAGAAVLMSFIIMARFCRHRSAVKRNIQFDICGLPGLKWFNSALLRNLLGLLSVAIFALVLATGFFGNSDPLKNFTPTFIWIIWWVGMVFISALVGNLWALVNPWSILFIWFSNLFGNRGAILQ